MLEDLKKYITQPKIHKNNTISKCIIEMLKKSKNAQFVEEFCKCVLDAPGDIIEDLREYIVEDMNFSIHLSDVFTSDELKNCMGDWCKVECINPLVYLLLSCFFEKGDIKIFANSGFTPHLIQDVLNDTYLEEYSFTAIYRKFLEEKLLPQYHEELLDENGFIDVDNFAGDSAIVGIKLLNEDKKEIFIDIMENLLDLSEDKSGWWCMDIWESQQGVLISYFQVWKSLGDYLNCVDCVRDDIIYDRVAAQFEENAETSYLIDDILKVKSSFREVIF